MADKKSRNTDAVENLTFEQAIAQLQQIVERVETGQVGLEEAIAQYETGCKLVQHCKQILEKAERKIETLSRGLDGQISVQPFSPKTEVDADADDEDDRGPGAGR